MSNQEHLDLLKQGVAFWNQWRKDHHANRPDLSEADLSRTNLREANLSQADLYGANLSGADLVKANLREANLFNARFDAANLSQADLRRASLHEAYLYKSNLSGVDLRRANLNGAYLYKSDLRNANLAEANLSETIFSGADLSEADLCRARLVKANLSRTRLIRANLMEANLKWANLSEADLSGADLRGCSIYAISAWNVELKETNQSGLIITRSDEPTITVDNLKVAQFIYLLLNNKDIRDAIDTITSKVVLILGRFTPERKAILDALRDELRKQNYSPVMFDFEKPTSRDLTETVNTLAHLARFIIVDLTEPSSAPHEVATIIPQCVVPVQPLISQEPLIVKGSVVERHEYAMFEDLRRRYHWVLPTFRYRSTNELLLSLQTQIIAPSEQKARDLIQRM